MRARAGNRAADEHAKLGAAMRPVDAGMSLRLRRADSAITIVGKWIGRLTARLVQNEALRDCQPPPAADEGQAKRLSSEPVEEGRLAGDAAEPQGQLEPKQDSESSHQAAASESSSAWPLFRAMADIASAAACSHVAMVAGDELFCGKCGARGTARAKLWKKPCRQMPTAAARSALERWTQLRPQRWVD